MWKKEVKNMRTKTISISERNLMFVTAGQLFDQAPNRQPRKAEIIMQKVKDAFRKDAYNDNEWYAVDIPREDVYKYIKTLLMGIPEFVDLNLSQVEFDKNISVDDESRPKYSFTSRYDVETPETWRRDFIDLDAFIRNVHNRLLTLMEVEQDCFCCKHTKTERCDTCLVNPILKYNFECSKSPKGKYTFACKYDCPAHCYICCEECDKKDFCANKCDGISDTCGNKVME
jgi:hypothetical protein